MPYRAEKRRADIFISGFTETEASLELHAKFNLYVYSSVELSVRFHQISRSLAQN